jgi:hypothetical protein
MDCVRDGREVDLDKGNDRVEWSKVSRRPDPPWGDKRDDDDDDDDDKGIMLYICANKREGNLHIQELFTVSFVP